MSIEPSQPIRPAKKGASVPAQKTASVGGKRFDAATLARIKAAVAWRPAEGDTLTCTIVAIVPREGGEYGRYPVVVVSAEGDDSGKLLAIHAFHGVMVNELKEMKAKAGDKIVVAYAGKREHNTAKDSDGNPRKYHSYSVVPAEGADIEEWDFDKDEVHSSLDD